MFVSTLIATGLVALSGNAYAASDLISSISGPSSHTVYATGRYTVTVSNIGNQTANTAKVVIQLPETNTSPQVYVMGTVVAKSSSCTQSGTKLTCTLGNIKRSNSVSVYVDLNLPYSADPLVLDATASTTSTENSSSNNSSSHTASLSYYSVSFTGPRDVLNQHCTGTGLAAWYECTLFPSSISSHDATFNADGSISMPYGAEYGGSWSQPTPDTLVFTYTEYGVVIAEFEGAGVGGDCWEGLTTFPGSTYVSPYEVCLQ